MREFAHLLLRFSPRSSWSLRGRALFSNLW